MAKSYLAGSLSAAGIAIALHIKLTDELSLVRSYAASKVIIFYILLYLYYLKKRREKQGLEVGCTPVLCSITLLFVSIALKVVLTLTSLDK